MDENRDNRIAEEEAYSLESILAEYRAQAELEEAMHGSAPVSRARSIVMEALDEQIASAVLSSREEPDAAAEAEPESAAPEAEPEAQPEVQAEAPVPEAPAEEAEEPLTAAAIVAELQTQADDAYASPGDYAPPADEAEDAREQARSRDARRRSLGERLTAPIVALLAAAALRRRGQDGAPAGETGETPPEIPEPAPGKAARHYAAQIKPLHLRGLIAGFLCVILIYIAYSPQLGLPLAGALGSDARVAAGICLLLELTVALCGLDVFACGLLNLFTGRPGAETLVSLSCLFSAADAVRVLLGGADLGLPFCAVSAVSMAFAIRGQRLTCIAMSASLRTAAVSKSPFTVTCEQNVADKGGALLKSQRGLAGFVHRCEGPDFNETAYGVAAPLLLIAAVLLSVLAAVSLRSTGSFLHILSALLAAGASFSALLNFAKPFATVARQLLGSGAAIAGWPGCADIGESRQVIVTDSDLFPAGTISSAGIRIIEGNFTDKVVSYTGSLLAASGSAVAGVFTELIGRYGYTLLHLEDFNVHEGGGLTATIGGDRVLVGSSGFMNLMGVRLPHNLMSKTAIFTAINSHLAGVFNINYTPVTSVQDALVSLLHGRGEPLFAVRDFNITPLMIRQKFKMPTESFNFPSYARRYEVSAAQPGEDSQIVAVLSRLGLGPLAGAAEKGRRLCRAVKLCTALSIAGSLVGMVLLFFLCRSGSFDAASAGNALSFMFLWLAPLGIVDFGLRR